MKWSLKGIKLQVTHSHYIVFFFIFYIFKLMEKEKAPCVVVPNSAPMWPGLHLVQAFILRDCPCFFLAKLFYSVGLLGPSLLFEVDPQIFIHVQSRRL